MKLTRPLLFASALAIAMGVQAQGMGNTPSGTSSGTTGAGTSSSTGSMSSSTSPMDDKTFVHQAAQIGLAEVELGKLAEKRASDPAVKSYAKQIVQEHTTNNKQLQKAAGSEKIKLPKGLSPEDKQARDELSKLSGKQFDERYVQVQIQDHQKAVDLYQNEANDQKNGAIEKYARSTLPHLQMHLDKANSLASQIGVSTSGNTAGSSAAGGMSGNSGSTGNDTGTGSGYNPGNK